MAGDWRLMNSSQSVCKETLSSCFLQLIGGKLLLHSLITLIVLYRLVHMLPRLGAYATISSIIHRWVVRMSPYTKL